MSIKSHHDCNDAIYPDFEHNRQKRSDAHSSNTLDSCQRDRWELLNAYLDSEVTPQEKRKVEEWLRNDTQMQCLYARLLQLRCGIQAVPVPPSNYSTEDIVQAVCRRIDRRPRRKLIWGGAAIIALLGTLFSSQISIPEYGFSNIFGDRDGADLSSDGLLVPLDKPLVPTPEKADNAIDVPLDKLIISVDKPLFELPKSSSSQAEDVDAN